MPTEQDALQALWNRVQGQIQALETRVRELKLLQASVKDLQSFTKGLPTDADQAPSPTAFPKGLVASLVREYVAEHPTFNTSQVVDHVLQDARVQRDRRHVYSAVYETLRRLNKAGWTKIEARPITKHNEANNGK